MLELAAWAREKGLGTRATELYRKILSIDSDQADARKALGYEKVAGQWLEGDDLMMARGFVKYRGRWYPRAMAERLMRDEDLARQENERLELAKRIADQRHAEELARQALEQERIDLERQGLGWSWTRNGWIYGPTWGYGPGYFLPAILPPPQPVPLTPPTVVPVTPPSTVPPSRPR